MERTQHSGMEQLLNYVQPNETAADFLARHVREALPTGLPVVDQQVTFRPGQIMELVGPSSAGKSEIIVQMIVNFLLTHTGSSSRPAEHVVLVDCDGKIDIVRMLQVLDLRLSALAPNMEAADILSRFHMVSVHSSRDLLEVLVSLPHQLKPLQGCCRLLLIDNIAAFSWQDRIIKPAAPAAPLNPTRTPPSPPAAAAAAAAAAGGASTIAGRPGQAPSPGTGAAAGWGGPGDGVLVAQPLSLQQLHAATAALLQLLCEQLSLAVVVSKQASVSLQADKAGGPQLVQREQLPLVWSACVSHRLLVAPASSLSLSPQQQRCIISMAPGPPPHTLLVAQWQGTHMGGLAVLAIEESGMSTMAFPTIS